MSKVLVLYYSSYGHVEALAHAVAEGARSAGATVDVKRVPETAPAEVAKAAYFKLDQRAPVATVAELADYDAIIIGAPTRFGVLTRATTRVPGASWLWRRSATTRRVHPSSINTSRISGSLPEICSPPWRHRRRPCDWRRPTLCIAGT